MTDKTDTKTDLRQPINGAESVLLGMRRNGIKYLFANAGTDFPPIIEALATLPDEELPIPITVPHESAGVAMAHGYYLVTGAPQAVMVHVNVGLANAVMGVINAASDNIPMLVLSGRTPLTERGHLGSRVTQIQYGQEMYDQASLVKDVVRFHYEMRYPEQGEPLISRALALSRSVPEGPSYISLPREPLSAPISDAVRAPIKTRPTATPPQPDPEAIEQLAGWVTKAKHPVILCQRGDHAGLVSEQLSTLASQYSIAVAEPYSIRNVLPSDHPMLLGYDAKAAIELADLIIVLDSGVPWIEMLHAPDSSTKIAHIGPDPHFARMPMREYQTDLAIMADPVAGLMALEQALDRVEYSPPSGRHDDITQRTAKRRGAIAAPAITAATDDITPEFFSKCVSEIMDESTIAFSELGVMAGAMNLQGPNRLFNNPHSGGLGWAFPAALGAQLADRDRLVIATMGDGSYIFANPTACHQIAEALDLPLLVILKNNGMWNAVRRSVVASYPDGAAVKSNAMPLTSLAPVPEFTQVASASRAHTERVENASQLPDALVRAVAIIRSERRQVLLDVRVLAGDVS